MLCSDPLLDSHRYKDIIEEAIAGGNFTGLFRKFPFFFFFVGILHKIMAHSVSLKN